MARITHVLGAGLEWLTGPIFGKELRIASRRRRHYVVRFVYLAVLIAILSLFWLEMTQQQFNAVNLLTRMAELGQGMTLMVVWFQFVLCPIIAAVMLSTAISDEIYHKTLGVMMTTPITSLQIVAGKLLSRLLQMMLLMGMSLPLLAIIRIFGGIPWMFLVSCLSVTLCTVLLAGSLALCLSISQRKAYVVIIQGVLVFAFCFGAVPMLAFLFGHEALGDRVLTRFFMVTNPYFCMAGCTEQWMSPGSSGFSQAWQWWVHCILLVAATALLILWAAVRVRRVALQQIAGGSLGLRHGHQQRKRQTSSPVHVARTDRLRTVKGWPLLWKDIRTPVLASKKWKKILVNGVMALLMLAVYAKIGWEGDWDQREVHVFFAVVYALLGTLFTIIIPATCITSEKESRSWPILLGTSLTERHILASKGLAMIRWCLPRWGLLFAHVLIFSLVGIVHPLAPGFLLMPVIGITMLATGTGLYWSARLKRTTTAVVANFALPVVLWGLLPLLWGIFVGITHGDETPLELYLNLNPFFQIGVITEAMAQGWAFDDFQWITGNYYWQTSSLILVLSSLGWTAVGLGFAWRAQFLFRKHVF